MTTNDSRLRLFNLDECMQKVKYKGYYGENLQLQTSLNSTDKTISIGSEDGNVFMFEIERSGHSYGFREPKPKGFFHSIFAPHPAP